MVSSRPKRTLHEPDRYILDTSNAPPPIKRARKHSTPTKEKITSSTSKSSAKVVKKKAAGSKASPKRKLKEEKDASAKSSPRKAVKPKKEKRTKESPTPVVAKRWKVEIRPSLKILEEDPFFSAKTISSVPFVSTNNFSKLAITAVLTKNKRLLQQILADKEHVSNPFIVRSANKCLSAIDYAVAAEDEEMIRMLVADKNSPGNDKRPPMTQCILSSPSTGNYNQMSLGISRIRKLETSRGSRQGNSALIENPDIRLKTDNFFMLSNGVSLKTMSLFKTLTATSSQRHYQQIHFAARSGHRQLVADITGKIVDGGRVNDFVGIGRLHYKVVESSRGQDLHNFRATSVTKKSKINSGITPLHLACINPNPSVLLALLNVFPEYSIADSAGWRPVHYAAACVSDGPLSLLLKRGVNPYEMNSEGMTPLHVACQAGREHNVLALINFAREAKAKAQRSAQLASKAKPKLVLKKGKTQPNFGTKTSSVHRLKKSVSLGNRAVATGDNLTSDITGVDNEGDDEEEDEVVDLSGQAQFGLAGINRPTRFSLCPIHFAASKGHKGCMIELLRVEGIEINQPLSATKMKMTPMMLAAEEGHYDLVKLFVKKYPESIDVKDKLKRTPLIHAVKSGHSNIVSYLLHHGANPNQVDTSGNTVLHYACSFGWIYCVDVLLAAGAKPNTPSVWMTTPLSAAFLCGNVGIVRRLLAEPEVDVNFKDDTGMTLVMMACQSRLEAGLVNQIKMLINDLKADCTAINGDGRTALHVLAANLTAGELKNNPKMMKLSVEVATLLISKGCDPHQKSNDEKLAIDVASINLNTGLVELLTNQNSLISSGTNLLVGEIDEEDSNTVVRPTLLHVLASNAYEFDVTPLLNILCKKTANLTNLKSQAQMRNGPGRTPLHLTLTSLYSRVCTRYTNDPSRKEAIPNALSFINMLIDKFGSKLDALIQPLNPTLGEREEEDENEKNTIENRHRFYKIKSFKFDKTLLEKEKGSGISVLLLALLMKDEKQELLALMIDACRKNGSLLALLELKFQGRTPLLEAVRLDQYDAIDILISAGAKVNTSDSVTKLSPLMAAVHNCNKEAVSLLLDSGSDLAAEDLPLRNTALHYACCYTKRSLTTEDIVSKLVNKCVENGQQTLLNAANSQGRTPLHLAANFNTAVTDTSAESELVLLEKGANLHAVDDRGRQPLHYAFVKIGEHSETKNIDPIEVAQVLCPASRYFVKDLWGMTPLQWAALRGATVSADFLVQRGADLNERHSSGNTALSFAVRSKHLNCAMSLIQLGADITISVVREPCPVKPCQDWSWRPIPPITCTTERYSKSLFRAVLEHHWSGLSYILAEKLPSSTSVSHLSLMEDCLITGVFRLALTLLRRWKGGKSEVSLRGVTSQSSLETLFHVFTRYAPVVREGSSDLETQQRLVHLLSVEWGIKAAASQKDARGCTPLVHCILRKHYKLAEHLIATKLASATEKDGLGRNALITTFWNLPTLNSHFKEWFKFLLSIKGVDINSVGDLPNLDPFAAAMKKRPKVDYFKKPTGSTTKITPLIAAIRAREFALVRYLLIECSASVNQSDSAGISPLMHAMQANSEHIVRLLTDYKYDGSKDYDKKAESTPNYKGGDFNLFKPVRKVQSHTSSEDGSMNDDGEDGSMNDDGEDGSMNDDGEDGSMNDDGEDGSMNDDGEDDKDEGENEEEVEEEDEDNESDVPKCFDDVKIQPRNLNLEEPDVPEDFMKTKVVTKLNVNSQDNVQRWTALHHCVGALTYGCYDNPRMILMLVTAGAKLDIKAANGETVLDLAIRFKAIRIAKTIQSIQKIPTKNWVLPKRSLSKNTSIPTPVFPYGDVDKDADTEMQRLDKTMMEASVEAYQPKPDPRSIMDKTSHVILDDRLSDRPMEALLSMVNVRRHIYGLFNFYQLQLLFNRVRNVHFLFTRWGRIGDIGQYQCTPFATFEGARKEFDKVFRAKTGNKWTDVESFEAKPNKYRLVTKDIRGKRCKRSTPSFNLKASSSVVEKLNPELRELYEAIIDIENIRKAMREAGVDDELLPLGRISPENVQKAISLLNTIAPIADRIQAALNDPQNLDVNKVKDDGDKLAELSDSYYWTVPQSGFSKENLEPLCNPESIDKQRELLAQLTDFHYTGRLMLAACSRSKQIAPLDYIHAAIGCRIQPMREEDKASQLILRMVSADSLLQNKEVRIKKIFRVDRPGEEKRNITAANNRKRLLWHGTKTANLLSILHHGLVVSMPGAVKVGQCYGRGVYLSDSLSKAQNYCGDTRWGNKKASFMLLCEVDLTDVKVVKNSTDDEDSTSKPPVKFIQRRTYPNVDGDVQVEDGFVMPLGDTINSDSYSYGFSECVVFQENRIKMKYLLQLAYD